MSEIRTYEEHLGKIKRAKSIQEIGCIVDGYMSRQDAPSVLRGRLDEAASKRIDTIRPTKEQ